MYGLFASGKIPGRAIPRERTSPHGFNNEFDGYDRCTGNPKTKTTMTPAESSVCNMQLCNTEHFVA